MTRIRAYMKGSRPYKQIPGRRCIGIAAALVLFMGCAVKYVEPVCRHKAVFCALTWSDLEYVPVRIAVGPSTVRDGRSHAQAQARVNGKWQWLVVSGDVIAVGEQDWWFEPVRHCTVAEMIEKHITIWNERAGKR